MPRGVTGRDWLGLSLLCVMWGTAFTFTRAAVASVPPIGVAAGRVAVGALVLVVAVRGLGLRLPSSPRLWVWFGAVGIVGNALPFFLISWGQERLSSGLAGILMAVNPLATLLLAHRFVEGERIHARRAWGFGLGFAGVVVLIGPEALAEIGGKPSEVVRQIAVLAGACCYAVASVLMGRMPATDARLAAAGVLAVTSLLVVPVAVAAGRPLAEVEPLSVAAVVWLGLVPTALATILYFRVIASAGPTFLSLVNYPMPVVAVLAGALVYGERPGLSALAGLALVLGALALAGPGGGRRT